MGYSCYSSDTRALRAMSDGYFTKSAHEVFTQSKARRSHPEMDSKGISLRECRDSEAHPNTFPIILGLDVTGSMGGVPHALIKDGLPTLMGNIIQKGIKDVSLCFLAIGDHECDRYPMQIAQFESGDAELDMWLTRTYLEGNGGGNAGESYLLAWEFAANRTVTDSFEKRGKKGLLITIGDEPNLKKLPKSAVDQIYGDASKAQGTVSADDLLDRAFEKWEVYHIDFTHNGRRSNSCWKQALGKNVIKVDEYSDIPNVIADLAVKIASESSQKASSQKDAGVVDEKEEFEML